MAESHLSLSTPVPTLPFPEDAPAGTSHLPAHRTAACLRTPQTIHLSPHCHCRHLAPPSSQLPQALGISYFLFMTSLSLCATESVSFKIAGLTSSYRHIVSFHPLGTACRVLPSACSPILGERWPCWAGNVKLPLSPERRRMLHVFPEVTAILSDNFDVSPFGARWFRSKL